MPAYFLHYYFFKAHEMPCATGMSNNNLKNIAYRNFFSVSNEINPILIGRFLGNE